VENGKNPIVLFFTPEASVTPHLAGQCLLARTLQDQGHNVKFAFCPGLFARCPVMDMYALPYDHPDAGKKPVCAQCTHQAQSVLAAYGLEKVSLDDYLDHSVLFEMVPAMENLPADLREFEFDGIPFGRICIQDLVLATKIVNYDDISQDNRTKWIQYINSAVLAYLLVGKICDTLDIGRIVTHQDYGILLGARLAGEKRGIPAYTVHAAWHMTTDRRNLVVVPQTEFKSLYEAGSLWPKWKDLCLDERGVAEIADDLLSKFGAVKGHVYSPPKTFDDKNLISQLGLDPRKKVVVAYTSSLDEWTAATALKEALRIPIYRGPQPFKDQIEWLQALLSHFENHPELQLVVRIHPREGANKREKTVSEHLLKLREKFGGTYRNCLIIWPEDPVSSYDLGEIAALALTSWSTISMELARLAVPVLYAFKGYAYLPHDVFLEWEENRDAYFRKLDAMASSAADLEHLRLAFRWYLHNALGRAIGLEDLVPDHDFGSFAKFRMPKAAATIQDVIIGGKDILGINLENLRRSQRPDSAELETLALKKQVRRLLHFLFTGKEPGRDFTLVALETDQTAEAFLDGLQLESIGPEVHLAITNGTQLLYIFEGECLSRFSPMGVRLARSGAQFSYADSGRLAVAAQPHARRVGDARELAGLIKGGSPVPGPAVTASRTPASLSPTAGQPSETKTGTLLMGREGGNGDGRPDSDPPRARSEERSWSAASSAPPRAYADIARHVETVEGWLLEGQEKFLFDKVRSLPDGATILEMGANYGRSTCAMAFACQGTGKRIYSVDTFCGNSGVMGRSVDFQAAWQANLARFGLDGYAIPLRGYTFEMLKDRSRFPAPHFVFIDASHEYFDVLQDFRDIYDYVPIGGWIAFHDVEVNWPGPWRVWHDYASHLLTDHQRVATLYCGRKSREMAFGRAPGAELGFSYANALIRDLQERHGGSSPLISALRVSLAGANGTQSERAALSQAEIRIAEAPEPDFRMALKNMLEVKDANMDGPIRLWYGLTLIAEGRADEAWLHLREAPLCSYPVPRIRVQPYLDLLRNGAKGDFREPDPPAPRLRAFASPVGPADTVIAFGSGDGEVLRSVPCGRKVGIEADRESRKEAIVKYGIDSVETIGELPDGIADVILCADGFEKRESPLQDLRALAAKLRRGGKAVFGIASPDRIPEDALYSWSARSLATLFRAAGFTALPGSVREEDGRLLITAEKP
jgi:predicted O-methyltransferase YrrM